MIKKVCMFLFLVNIVHVAPLSAKGQNGAPARCIACIKAVMGGAAASFFINGIVKAYGKIAVELKGKEFGAPFMKEHPLCLYTGCVVLGTICTLYTLRQLGYCLFGQSHDDCYECDDYYDND